MRKPLIAAGLLAATLAGAGAYAQQPPAPPGGGPTDSASPVPQPPGGQGSGTPGFIIVEGPPQGGPAGPGQSSPALPGANPLIMGGPAAGRAMQEQMMRGAPPRPMPRPPMMMGGPGEPDREEGMAMMHGRAPRGAVFAFRRGDQRVMIKCADDEPTKACVDGATALLDKLSGATPGAAQGGPTQ